MSTKKINTDKLDNIMQNTSSNMNYDPAILNNGFNNPLPISTKHVLRKQIDPKLLMPNPKKQFNMEEDAEYQALEVAIEQTGINNDLIVKPISDGGAFEYMILSGHRRHQIALKKNMAKVPIKIKEFDSELEETIFLIQENISTRQKHPLDIARSIQELELLMSDDEQISGRKRDVIAEKLGISSRSVYNYALLIDLPVEIQEWLNKNLITVSQAQSISSLPAEYQSELIDLYEADITNETLVGDKKLVIKGLLSTISQKAKRAEKKAENKGPLEENRPKAPDKALKKALSCLTPIQNNFAIPKSRKKKEEVIQQIDTALHILEELKLKMTEVISNK